MAVINIYQGHVTAGKTDGTLVSTNGTMSAPVDVVLDPQIDETKVIPLAIRAMPGYKTSGKTVITDNNDSDDRWKLSWTMGGTFSDSIQTSREITAVNTLFFAKVSASSTETITEDTLASLKVNTKIVSDNIAEPGDTETVPGGGTSVAAGGIAGVLLDGVEQYVNYYNYVELDLSNYQNPPTRDISWMDIKRMFQQGGS